MITAKITAEPTALSFNLVFSLNCRELNEIDDIKLEVILYSFSNHFRESELPSKLNLFQV